jgi:hypothetical protein
MDRARYIIKLFEEQSLAVTAWGMTHIRPLPKNEGLMFRAYGNRFRGLIKVRYDSSDIYSVVFRPSEKGEVVEKRGVKESELVDVITEAVGQSPMLLEFYIDMYLIK